MPRIPASKDRYASGAALAPAGHARPPRRSWHHAARSTRRRQPARHHRGRDRVADSPRATPRGQAEQPITATRWPRRARRRCARFPGSYDIDGTPAGGLRPCALAADALDRNTPVSATSSTKSGRPRSSPAEPEAAFVRRWASSLFCGGTGPGTGIEVCVFRLAGGTRSQAARLSCRRPDEAAMSERGFTLAELLIASVITLLCRPGPRARGTRCPHGAYRRAGLHGHGAAAPRGRGCHRGRHCQRGRRTRYRRRRRAALGVRPRRAAVAGVAGLVVQRASGPEVSCREAGAARGRPARARRDRSRSIPPTGCAPALETSADSPSATSLSPSTRGGTSTC